jgi:outer membrane immunogenic protein
MIMDKKIALAAALAASFAGSALAADLPSKKAPVAAPPVMSWTGFYVGANAGGAWSGNNSGSLKVYGGAPALSAIPVGNKVFNNYGGFLGGGQVGYNYQLMQSFVIGAEADIQGLAGNSGTANFTGFSSDNGTSYTTVGKASSNLQYIGTVRGRVGYLVMPTLLAYGTAGFAYGGVSSTVSLATGGTDGSGGGTSIAYTRKNNYICIAQQRFICSNSGYNTQSFECKQHTLNVACIVGYDTNFLCRMNVRFRCHEKNFYNIPLVEGS